MSTWTVGKLGMADTGLGWTIQVCLPTVCSCCQCAYVLRIYLYSLHPACPENAFICSDGKCIHPAWLCDGMVDCVRGQDERTKNCYPGNYYVTAQRQFLIMSSEPPSTWVRLFSFSDEEEEEEETGGGVGGLCPIRQYRCSDGTCIPESYLCDGYANDCPRNEDEERDCTTSGGEEEEEEEEEEVVCREDEYQCGSDQTCIPMRYLCDGFPNDCQGNEDEDHCDNGEWEVNTCAQLDNHSQWALFLTI